MAASIPILDLEAGAREEAAFARALHAALSKFGFVGVRGHGIDAAVVERAFATARAFFGLPLAVKLRCEVAGGAGQRGYTRFGVEKAKDRTRADLQEFFHVGREVAPEDPLAHVLRPNE